MHRAPLEPAPGDLAFTVLPDGGHTGDDGSQGALAASLSYICRLAAQVGELWALGQPRSLSVVGGRRRLDIDITWTTSTHLGRLSARGRTTAPVRPWAGDQAKTLDDALALIRQLDGVTGCLVLASGHRQVGVDVDLVTGNALLAQEGFEAGRRLGAIFDSLDTRIPAKAAWIAFREADVVVVGIGPHRVVVTGRPLTSEEIMQLVPTVHGLIHGLELEALPTLSHPVAPPQRVHETAAPEPEPTPAPSDPQPKKSKRRLNIWA